MYECPFVSMYVSPFVIVCTMLSLLNGSWVTERGTINEVFQPLVEPRTYGVHLYRWFLWHASARCAKRDQLLVSGIEVIA